MSVIFVSSVMSSSCRMQEIAVSPCLLNLKVKGREKDLYVNPGDCQWVYSRVS